MTRHERQIARDLGPLFDWQSGRSGTDGIAPDRADSQENSGPPQVAVRTIPNIGIAGSEFLNDSAEDPRSGILPLRGDASPDFSAVPSESSAALTLRSQRTDSGDSGSDPGSAPEGGDQDRAPTLRPYQTAAIAAIDAEFARGIQRTLLVLPTGCGKTVVFAEWARGRVAGGRRVIVLAHRTELLEQAAAKLADVGVHAAIEKAERRAGRAPVVVASVQTLQRQRLAALDPGAFDIVVDEGHHAPARTYRAILDHFPGALVLVVTATPDRADGKALGEIVSTCAYRYELRDAIRDRWLVPIVARRIFVESIDLSGVRSRAGDLATDELAEVMANDAAVIGVIGPLLEQAGDRRTIVFAVDVAHSTALAKAMCERRPGCARVAHGELDDRERRQILEDFRAGEFQFLVNCALYTEGFDEPSVGCIACARPTKSRGLYTQMVGRGTRLLGKSLDESIANGKHDCLILDFVGNAGRHRLIGPLDPLLGGEEVDEDLRKEAERLLLEEEHELDGLLEAAEESLEQRRQEARRSANVQYFARDIDPFLGEELGEPCLEPWALEPATKDQLDRLVAIGMKKIPPSLQRGEAVRILDAVAQRDKLGLASYKQSKILAQFGYDTRSMTKAQASRRIGILELSDYDTARARPRLAQLEATEMLAKERR
jgi:superfamily II DNA or RNA helicase